MDDSRPYTIPYSGSRSRNSTEGFAPASQPPPTRKMDGSVAPSLQGATVAENPPAPSSHGTGPSAMVNFTTEQACNAYLGPMKYRCQPTVEDPPADTVVHLAENTVESAHDKRLKSRVGEAHNGPVKKSTEVASTLSRSMDGACDEPEAPETSHGQSSENGLHDLSECRPCRLFTIAHDGQRPEFCDRCKILKLTCSLCNHELCPAAMNQQTADESRDAASSLAPTSLHQQLELKIEQQSKDLDQAHLKIQALQNQLHQQSQQSDSRIQNLTRTIDQEIAHSEGVIQNATRLQSQIVQQGGQIRDQEAAMAEMRRQINQLAATQEAHKAAIQKIEADVIEFTRRIFDDISHLRH